MERNGSEGSLGDLVGRLAAQTVRLMRLEVSLAKAETARTARRAAGFLGALMTAAVLGLVALAMAVTVVVLALSEVMPAWAAALVVLVVSLMLALPLGLIGARGLQRTIANAPREAVEGAKEELEWTRTPS